MVKVMKSPNMMSTTGRSPVMAAPTASPVKPASEIGVSSTRSLPNSSKRPARTLNGVPASATSSPRIQTVLSRRISSAMASRIACAKVSSHSPVSGIHVLVHFTDGRVGRRHGEVNCTLHLGLECSLHPIKHRNIGEFLLDQPLSEVRDRVPLRFPCQFFLLGAIVFAVDVAHVMAVVTIRVAEQKRRTITAPGSIHQALGNAVNRTYVLTVHAGGFQAEGCRPHQDVSSGGFRVVGIFGIEIVLADVNHGELVKLGEVHHFIQHTLAERAFPEETYCDPAVTETLSGKRGSGGDTGAAAYDRIRSQVAGRRVRNVHGASLALSLI